MPLFFIAAGWVFKERTILSCVEHRCRTIIMPYFSFGIVTIVYWWFVERRFMNIGMSFVEALVGLFRGQYEYLRFDVPLWFLPCFFMTVVVYNVLYRSMGKGMTYLFVTVMSVIYIINVLPSLPWGIDRMFKYIGFYAIGNAFAGINADEKMKGIRNVMISVLLLGGVLVLSLYSLTSGIFWFVTGTMGTVAVMIISVNGHASIHIERFVWKPLQVLGQVSLVILCCHGPIYRAIIMAFSMSLHMSTEEVRTNFTLVAVVVLLTVLLCFPICRVVMSYVPWIVGKPSKGRNI